jgi:hypothetical protein
MNKIGGLAMHYFRCIWIHDHPDDPVEIFTECDDERLELRKVEIFADGSATWANATESTGDTILAEVAYPPIAEINERPEFRFSEISRAEFEAVWNRTRQFQKVVV